MPGPQHKLLQLGHDNAVVNLVPTIHNQVASHGIHGIELAAGVGGTQHRLVDYISIAFLQMLIYFGFTYMRIRDLLPSYFQD